MAKESTAVGVVLTFATPVTSYLDSNTHFQFVVCKSNKEAKKKSSRDAERNQQSAAQLSRVAEH